MTSGRVERVERHVERLRRDAGRLGLPLPDRRAAERLLLESAAETFGDGDGIVRLEWSSRPDETPTLVAIPRAYVAAPDRWHAMTARSIHPGRGHRANTKFVRIDAIEGARAEREAAAADEALLFDADGLLVEGSSTNVLLVGKPGGPLSTPDRALGGVEGLGLQIIRDDYPDLTPVRADRETVRAAAELIVVNAVRGAVPVVRLDSEPVADGRPGAWAARLAAIFGGR